MFPSCRPAPLAISAVLLLSLTSPSAAKINEAAVVLAPVIAAAKSCSGAFRYAARVGNNDIVAISPVQVFAADRRLARTRYSGRALAGLGTEGSPILSANTMCG
jgi:hypothetical protein